MRYDGKEIMKSHGRVGLPIGDGQTFFVWPSPIAHAFVADLDEERLHLVEHVYLPYLFPKSCRAEVVH